LSKRVLHRHVALHVPLASVAGSCPQTTVNRPGSDGGSISWRKMESCQTTPAATGPLTAIQLS
jgi:hypothetical protein